MRGPPLVIASEAEGSAVLSPVQSSPSPLDNECCPYYGWQTRGNP
jgi:hypothetical protein